MCHAVQRWSPLTLAELGDASADDDNESRHLGIGEDVLHPSAPLHIRCVDEREQA